MRIAETSLNWLRSQQAAGTLATRDGLLDA